MYFASTIPHLLRWEGVIILNCPAAEGFAPVTSPTWSWKTTAQRLPPARHGPRAPERSG